MIRPRHRQKSGLLWKMLGVAGAINLVLWPFLIHEGVFAGIRQEILIPVTLVSLPPSHKLPDALQIVARTPSLPSVPLPTPRPRVRQAQKPPLPPRIPAARTAAVITKIAAVPTIPKIAPSKPLVALVPRTVVRQIAPSSVEPHPIRVARTKPAKTIKPARPAAQAEAVQNHPPSALAARVARAKQLEAEGHQVAEVIAQQRADREAALPSDGVPITPTAVTQPLPPSLPITEQTVAVPQPRPRPVSRDVAPVAVRKAYPSVPDTLMKSSWHATFHGQFTVHRDGTATVRMVSSTGMPVLDQRAMQAARRWKFLPARRNGVAVASTQPFAFEYDVHPAR